MDTLNADLREANRVEGGDRLLAFENAGADFPFYKGLPTQITGSGWLFVLASVAAAFAVLIWPVAAFRGALSQFVPALLFAAIPLIGLAIVAPRHWTSLFRSVMGRDVLWMFVFGFLNVVVTLSAGMIARSFFGLTANAAVAELGALNASERVYFYMKTIPQLLGEELITILPFLAILYLLVSKMRVSRIAAVVVAWLSTAVMFGLAHLPTYGWNVAQVLLLIGLARLFLTLPYIKTKNVWVSTGAHIINDWIFFSMSLLAAKLPSGS